MPIGLHHLRYFVAVADEGHVSRAAARLRISQPSLSAQIQYLENQVGVALVHRHSRGVTLTPAGEAFVHHARAALAAADTAIDAARLSVHGQAGSIRVGFIVGTQIEITSRILSLFQECHPRVVVELVEHSFTDPSGGLNRGEVDVAFVMPPFQHSALHFLHLFETPRIAVMPSSHPLASRAAISVTELFDDPWVVTDTDDVVCRDFWLAMSQRTRPATLGQRIRSLDKFIQLVVSGNTVGLAAAWVQEVFTRPGVAYVPVTDIAPATTALAWNPARTSGLTDHFIGTAREVLAPTC